MIIGSPLKGKYENRCPLFFCFFIFNASSNTFANRSLSLSMEMNRKKEKNTESNIFIPFESNIFEML